MQSFAIATQRDDTRRDAGQQHAVDKSLLQHNCLKCLHHLFSMQEADPRGEEFNATPLRCSKQPVAGLVCLASKAGRTLRDL